MIFHIIAEEVAGGKKFAVDFFFDELELNSFDFKNFINNRILILRQDLNNAVAFERGNARYSELEIKLAQLTLYDVETVHNVIKRIGEIDGEKLIRASSEVGLNPGYVIESAVRLKKQL